MATQTGNTLFQLDIVENLRIAVGISTLSVIVPEIIVFPVWAAVLLFPVVGRCRNLINWLLLLIFRITHHWREVVPTTIRFIHPPSTSHSWPLYSMGLLSKCPPRDIG